MFAPKQVRTVAPPVSALSLEDAKAHLRLTTNDDDDYVEALCEAATEWMERYLHRALVEQTWQLKLDGWPAFGLILLDWVPVQSVDSITYIDPDGVMVTWAANQYELSQTSELVYSIRPVYGVSLPSLRVQRDAITVTYTAGYPPSVSSPVDYRLNIPKAIKHGMLMLVAEMYENRETNVVGTIVTQNPAWLNLIQPFRTMDV